MHVLILAMQFFALNGSCNCCNTWRYSYSRNVLYRDGSDCFAKIVQMGTSVVDDSIVPPCNHISVTDFLIYTGFWRGRLSLPLDVYRWLPISVSSRIIIIYACVYKISWFVWDGIFFHYPFVSDGGTYIYRICDDLRSHILDRDTNYFLENSWCVLIIYVRWSMDDRSIP